MYRHVIKRALDLFLSLLALPFFLLLCLVVGSLIWAEDHGPIFYNAPRLGRNGHIFKMYKFRSMYVNAPDLRNRDGSTFNSEEDPRVTRIGRILRKTSIDEIPQILNILKGDMSLIGPRPDLPDALEIFTPEEARKLNVRPGITGYSQAYFRNSDDLRSRFRNDVYYADHVSFWLDVRIFFQTFATVLAHRNVYRNQGAAPEAERTKEPVER